MWVELMESVQQAGVEFLRENPQTDELERAEGSLYLTQQLATSMQAVLAERDKRLPLLRLGATNIGKWGLDAPDAKYQGALLAQANYLGKHSKTARRHWSGAAVKYLWGGLVQARGG